MNALKKWYITVLAALSPVTVIKISDIQPVEFFLIFASFLAGGVLCLRSGRMVFQRAVIGLSKRYLIFFGLVAISAVSALRMPTFPPTGISVLKVPPYLLISRFSELALCVGGFLIACEILGKREYLRRATRIYIWVGFASCVYGLLSWIVLLSTGVELGGAYGPDHRVRGFFIEGGPYGVFVVSVLVVLLFRARCIEHVRFRRHWIEIAVLLLTFALSRSKAGVAVTIALVCLTLILNAAAGRTRKRMLLLAAIYAGISLPFLVIGTSIYIRDYFSISDLVAANPEDTNLVLGRVTGMIIVPRMIAAHPITGIGLGDYSVMRNDPDYLQSLPSIDEWDLPGLGILGYAAEIGIPTLAFLLYILWVPVALLNKIRSYPVALALAAFQVFAHLFGVQLNFFYPWLISAFAVGYWIQQKEQSSLPD